MDYELLRAHGISGVGLTIAEAPVIVEPPVVIGGSLSQCFIGQYSVIHPGMVGRKTTIGRYTQVAAGSFVGIGGHPTDWLSTHYFQYRDDAHQFPKDHPFNLYQAYEEYQPTQIGNDCWIGAQCFVKSGVKIGDGAVIWAGAVVTGDIPPYAIAMGVPAKIVRFRFPDAVIAKLLEIKWWEFPRTAISHLPFNQPELCIEMLDRSVKMGTIERVTVKSFRLG